MKHQPLPSIPMESTPAFRPTAGLSQTRDHLFGPQRFGFVALGLGLLAAGASLALFGASGRDDPYITFSAAEAIIQSGRLANINGDAIEQSTTLLLTLLLAALGWLTGASIPILGWLISFAALAAITPTAYAILRHTLTESRALAAAVTVTITPPLVYWSASGAEQSLSVLLTLLLVLLLSQLSTRKEHWWAMPAAAVTSLLIFLSRPDLGLSALAATGVLALLTVVRHQHVLAMRLGVLTALQVLLVLVTSLGRLSVTGSPLPQPLTAKVGTNFIEQVSRGMGYFVTNALSPWFIIFLIVSGVIFWTTRFRLLTTENSFLLLNAAALIAGTILSGGDWMELGRFFAAPATFVVLAVLSVTQGLSTRRFVLASTALLISQVATLLYWSVSPVSVESRGSNVFSRWELDATGSPGVPRSLSTPFNRWNADHLGDAYFVGAAVPAVKVVLETNPAKQFTIASGQGGLIPYALRQEFGDRIRFIDRFQLMTDDFAECDLVAGTYGSFISWNQWEKLAGQCAPELPDMVFSIGPIPFDDLGDDYEVVVHVQGSAIQGEGSLPQEQWLAVKRDYVGRTETPLG